MDRNPDIVSPEEKPLGTGEEHSPPPFSEDGGRSFLPSKDIISIAHYISSGVGLKMDGTPEYKKDELRETKGKFSEHLVSRRADVQELDNLADAVSEKIGENEARSYGWEQQIPLQVVSEIYECEELVGMEDMGAILAVVTRLFKARGWVPS